MRMIGGVDLYDMKFVVYKQTRIVPKKEPVKRTLLWYDKFYGKMQTFECTKLDFDYKEEKFVEVPKNGILYKIPEKEATQIQKDVLGVRGIWCMRPRPTTYDKIVVTKEEINPAEQWFNKFMNHSSLDISIVDKDNTSITFQIDEGKDADNFEDELYRNRFNYKRLN